MDDLNNTVNFSKIYGKIWEYRNWLKAYIGVQCWGFASPSTVLCHMEILPVNFWDFNLTQNLIHVLPHDVLLVDNSNTDLGYWLSQYWFSPTDMRSRPMIQLYNTLWALLLCVIYFCTSKLYKTKVKYYSFT